MQKIITEVEENKGSRNPSYGVSSSSVNNYFNDSSIRETKAKRGPIVCGCRSNISAVGTIIIDIRTQRKSICHI